MSGQHLHRPMSLCGPLMAMFPGLDNEGTSGMAGVEAWGDHGKEVFPLVCSARLKLARLCHLIHKESSASQEKRIVLLLAFLAATFVMLWSCREPRWC